MVQTNFEEMQKLGEKLQELVAEARPLVKDMKVALKQWEKIERDIGRALQMTMEKATEAAEIFRLCKEMDKVMEKKMANMLTNARMVDIELKKLQELHGQIQRDIVKSVETYKSHVIER